MNTRHSIQTSESKQVRWHLLYYGLATFNIATILLSVFLTSQVLSIYRISVTENQSWSERASQIANLADVAGAVNSPGNDVFQSDDVPLETQNLTLAMSDYEAKYRQVTEEIQSHVPDEIAASLLGPLMEFNTEVRQIQVEATDIFQFLGTGDRGKAGEHMAQMDRAFGRAMTQNTNLRESIRTIQNSRFTHHTDRAARLAQLSVGIIVMVVATILGAVYFGALSRRLVRAEQEQAAEAQRLMQLQNVELRHYSSQLEDTKTELDLNQETLRKNEQRLRISEERFEIAVRGSQDGIWDWNVLTNAVYFSPRLKELLEYADHELPNEFAAFETRLHPDDHDWVMREVAEHLQRRKPYDVEYRLRTKSGEYRWFRARGQAIWNSAGEPQRMAGSITDMTEAHRLRERFRLAVEASPTALLMVRHDGRILMANSRCLTLFGYTTDELIGQLIEVVVPPRFRAGHPARRNQFFLAASQRPMGAELDLLGVRKDGSEFPVKVGLSPVDTAEGLVVICGVTDITDQLQTLEVLRQAKEAAESASRAKSSFLANMSHEIRTPMNGIIGMTQLLSKTELRSHQRDYLATVDESAHVLLRLLNDILDFSKIEAGKLELECIDFRISECVVHASQMLALRAAEKGLEIACRIAPEIPDHLRGDPDRLRQVLVNLIGNAVKFTATGEIFLDINVESLAPELVRLHFSVRDTGIGIPANKQDQIFHPFEQAEASTTRRFGGTGLGLTISRQLVEMMHGRMWLDSEPGRGATFHFTAEFGIAAEQHRHAPAELESLRDLPVLVVDDNLTNRRILSELLQHWQMQPVLADSAAAARHALQTAAESQHPFRLVLLDHHMPGEDGFQFVESVHDILQRERCPIIMISSGSSHIDSDLCQKHGIDRFMTKPVIASELLNEVLRQFGKRSTLNLTPPLTPPTAAHVHPRRVLLVEDNEINRRVAIGMLRSRGHQVVVAENGQEAVNTLAAHEFDVVLMDMQMPVMDGYEATAAIRQREHHTGGHIPIVAVTAEALKGDRERCLACGMDDYVSKPISPAEMYRAVESFPALCLPAESFSKFRAGAAREGAAPAEPSAVEKDGSAGASPSHSTLPVLDWHVAKVRLGGGVEVLREFSELVKSQTPSLLTDIRHALEAHDSVLLRRAAHTLKGSATYFGAEATIQAAMDLENLGRTESFDRSAAKLESLEHELARFFAILNAGPPAD